MIPLRDEIWVAPVSDPGASAGHGRPLRHLEWLNIDLCDIERLLLNRPESCQLTPDKLMSAPRLWRSLSFESPPIRRQRAELSWLAERDGIVSGFAAWFRTELFDGIGFSSGPESPPSIYRIRFFPIPSPCFVDAGARISLDLEACLNHEDYVWVWRTTLENAGRASETKFVQSTLDGIPADMAAIRRRSGSARPRLSDEGSAVRAVLEALASGRSVGEAASEVHRDFPSLYPRFDGALALAGELAERYGS